MRWKSDLWPVRPSFIMKANIIKGNSLNLKTGNVEEHRWIHQNWGHGLKYPSLTSCCLEKHSGHNGTMIRNTIQCNAVLRGPWWVCLPKLIDIMWEVNCFIDIIPILKRAKGKNYLSVFPKRIILTMPCNFIRFILNIWWAKFLYFNYPEEVTFTTNAAHFVLCLPGEATGIGHEKAGLEKEFHYSKSQDGRSASTLQRHV